MNNLYQIYLISDATGETLDRIFIAIKAQFKNIDYKIHTFSFTRTVNQILKILESAETNKNAIILYSIVDSNLAKYLAKTSNEKKIPCFGVLGDLILSFSKLLNQKASHQPSGQYAMDEEYYERIEAIQFTMNHDDGNLIKENSYGGSLFDSGQDIVEGPYGSYFLTGFSQSHDGNLINNKGSNDIAILHITSFKAIINSLNIGGSKIDIGNSSVFNRSGSLFVVGSSNSSDGDFTFSFGGSDLFVAKYD